MNSSKRRNNSALPPLTQSFEAPVREWHTVAEKRKRYYSQTETIKAMSRRINLLSGLCRQLEASLEDVSNRLKFLEIAPKLKAGPR